MALALARERKVQTNTHQPPKRDTERQPNDVPTCKALVRAAARIPANLIDPVLRAPKSVAMRKQNQKRQHITVR